jgi:hypothetical protein
LDHIPHGRILKKLLVRGNKEKQNIYYLNRTTTTKWNQFSLEFFFKLIFFTALDPFGHMVTEVYGDWLDKGW